MKKDYFSPEITEVQALTDTYCASLTASGVIDNGFGDNANDIEDNIVDLD